MESKREVSEFNNAFGYLNHLNGLFVEASIHSKNLDMYNWFNTLNALFRVLSAELTSKELEEYLVIKKDLKFKIFLHLSNKRNTSIPEDLYNDLEMFEIRLRKIYKVTGLMNKAPDDAMSALR